MAEEERETSENKKRNLLIAISSQCDFIHRPCLNMDSVFLANPIRGNDQLRDVGIYLVTGDWSLRFRCKV
jgi:hypothetical protein